MTTFVTKTLECLSGSQLAKRLLGPAPGRCAAVSTPRRPQSASFSLSLSRCTPVPGHGWAQVTGHYTALQAARPPGCQPPRPARACRHHGFRWHSGTRAAAQQLSSAQRLSRFLGENLCSTCSQPRLFPRGWSPLDSEEVGGGGPQTTLPHRLCPLDTSPETLSAPTPGPRLAAHTRTRPRDKCQAAKSSLGLPGPPLRHPPPGIRPTHWQRDKPVASGGTDAPGARAHPRRCQEPLASSKISTRDGLCVKGILSDLRVS